MDNASSKSARTAEGTDMVQSRNLCRRMPGRSRMEYRLMRRVSEILWGSHLQVRHETPFQQDRKHREGTVNERDTEKDRHSARRDRRSLYRLGTLQVPLSCPARLRTSLLLLCLQEGREGKLNEQKMKKVREIRNKKVVFAAFLLILVGIIMESYINPKIFFFFI